MTFNELPPEKQRPIIDNFNSIKGILHETDADEVKIYVDWMLKQLVDSANNEKEIQFNAQLRLLKKLGEKQHYSEINQIRKKRQKVRADNYPYNPQEAFVKGDVVHMSFGAGYCDEISDGHYGIILSDIVGTMYLVAPLSSRKPRGILERFDAIKSFDNLNLPSKCGKDISYVEYNQIRFVHFRRLEFFGNRQKSHISPEDVNSITETFFSIIKNPDKIK